MEYKKLTLDWDYYMVKMLTKHKEEILNLIKSTCGKVEILDTKKGLNLIADLKNPADLHSLILLRLYCFDDIFRIRNEIDKDYDGQPHRINRIWLEKDGHTKTKILDADASQIELSTFEALLDVVAGKRPIKEKKENVEKK